MESFKRLDQMGAIIACGMGEQADKLAEEYIRLAEQKLSAVVVSQTWTEVHRVNSRVRDALKSKGLLGANDVTAQVLEKSDLTNAQKRDLRFYPKDGVIVFNQKVRQVAPGASGKLLGIVKIGVLVEVDGKCVTVANKQLDKITVCLPREIPMAAGERLHLKANRNLTAGARTMNGELVTVKTVRPDGGIELADGRVLGKNFREFLPGYSCCQFPESVRTRIRLPRTTASACRRSFLPRTGTSPDHASPTFPPRVPYPPCRDTLSAASPSSCPRQS